MNCDFTTDDWIAHLKTYDIPSLNDWLIGQANRGVPYFVNRLDMLDLNGGVVLDAGCGAGNWTIALAKRFDHVVALDSDPIRLKIVTDMSRRLGEVTTQLGSTEEIPYGDGTFDTVFCSGVVFITDCGKTISELHRVLRPGGILYMSFVGENWWRYLLRERGPNEPPCIKFGADGLLSLYFRRADEIDLTAVITEDARSNALKLIRRSMPSWGPRFFDTTAAAFSRFQKHKANLTKADLERFVVIIARELSTVVADPLRRRRAMDALNALHDLTSDVIPMSYRERIIDDFLSRALLRRGHYKFDVHTYAYEPEDMSVLLAERGFKAIQMANEGSLKLRRDAVSEEPIYERCQGVFETLCVKA